MAVRSGQGRVRRCLLEAWKSPGSRGTLSCSAGPCSLGTHQSPHPFEEHRVPSHKRRTSHLLQWDKMVGAEEAPYCNGSSMGKEASQKIHRPCITLLSWGVQGQLRHNHYPSLWLRIFVLNFSDSHLSKTPPPIGRVYICWKYHFNVLYLLSLCSNTTVALLSWKIRIVKSDLGDNTRWELQDRAGDNFKELPCWFLFFFFFFFLIHWLFKVLTAML